MPRLLHAALALLLLAALTLVQGMAPLQEGCPGTGEVTAKNDVDIYDSPVKPRKVVGMMRDGASAALLERHSHGWCKLDKLKLFDGTTAPGWVAEDHLRQSAQKPKESKYEHLKCYLICRDQCIATRTNMTWDECIEQCLIGTRC